MQNPIFRILIYLFITIKRIFNRDSFILSNLIPFFLIAPLFFYQFCEYHYSNLIKASNSIASNLLQIQPSSKPITNDSFVYILSNSMEYPLLIDKDFEIQTNAAILHRSIEYCQWIEKGFDSTDKKTRTRRYIKSWVKNPIDSSDFMDLRYFNPNGKIPLKDIYIHADSLPFGNYTINSDIFSKNTKNFSPFQQEFQEKKLFNFSFNFIGNGIFYFYYNNSRKDANDCTPGDIRIKYSQFSPKVVSIFGLHNSTTHEISTKTINEFEFGAMEAGVVKMSKLLLIKYRKIRLLTMFVRFFIFTEFLLVIFKRSENQIVTIWKLVLASLIVKLNKFIIWNGDQLLDLFSSFLQKNLLLR